jgi:adenylate cyclase
MADRLCFPDNIRLACQTAPNGSVTVRRLVLDDDDIAVNDQTLDSAMPGAVGTERIVTIMFADIRNFTTFSETHLPYDVIHFLNRYFHRIDQVIRAYGGYIDNYIGDGIMALFGTKDDGGSEAAYNAVSAGLDMLMAVEDMRPYAEEIFNWDFKIGIGIHCGTVVVGSIGSTHRPTETAIGDAVNLASRIEQYNKQLGTELLVSRDVLLNSNRELTIGQTMEVNIKGKSGRYTLYEVIGVG